MGGQRAVMDSLRSKSVLALLKSATRSRDTGATRSDAIVVNGQH
jgi:hypothetical protein